MYTAYNGKIDIKSLTFEELGECITQMGLERYRAGQIYRNLFLRLCDSFDCMTELSSKHKELLKEKFEITDFQVLRHLVSKIDGTEKFLFGLPGGGAVESVYMKYEHGGSVCVSTQVGCKMGCSFCASTKAGFERNLLPSEILGQIEKIIKIRGEKISNIVLMGIGEPLDNYDNVLRFLKLVNDERGLNIGYRHISLSTCGVVPMIKRLAEENLPITLSVSLHATTDEKRSSLMPINRKYPIAELLEACRYYQKNTTRRISFEYAVIDGINDAEEDAKRLARLLSGIMCHVNVIPVNEIREKTYKKSSKNAIELFTNTLKNSKINVTVRRKLGGDINAACGQLRRDMPNL